MFTCRAGGAGDTPLGRNHNNKRLGTLARAYNEIQRNNVALSGALFRLLVLADGARALALPQSPRLSPLKIETTKTKGTRSRDRRDAIVAHVHGAASWWRPGAAIGGRERRIPRKRGGDTYVNPIDSQCCSR